MLMKIRFAILVSFVLWALLGCASSSGVEGTWVGSIQLPPMDAASKLRAETAMADLIKVKLTLGSDSSFDLTMLRRPFHGHWTLVGNEVNLKVETIDGVPLDQYKKDSLNLEPFRKPLLYRWSDDKASLTSVPSTPTESVAVLKRTTQ